MKFSYNWLSEYVSRMPLAEQLAGNLTMRSFEVESVEQKGDDWTIDVKVLSNRAFDCLSHLGLAQEIVAISNLKFKEPAIKIAEDKKLKVKDFLSVEVKEKKLCPRYSARVIIDIKVGESPEWLKDKLGTCGLRPINNIVDITNYVMLETGQPLHAFDFDKLTSVIASDDPATAGKERGNPEQLQSSAGLLHRPVSQRAVRNDIKKIIVRRAKKGEKIITLDEGRAERVLNENILVIADAKSPIAIAGVKGGKNQEIDNNTKRIVLEAANFDSVNIRKNSRGLGLRTDASWRFENGVDINLTIKALDRAAVLIAQLSQGRVVSGIVDVASVKKTPWNVGVKHSYIENLLGIGIEPAQIINIFRRLDLSVKQAKKGKDLYYEIKIPTRRADLIWPEDLIEEIGRLYGYENIPSKLPSGVLVPATKDEKLIYADMIRNVFVGFGWSETYNYSFVSEADKEEYGLDNLAELDNPLSLEQKYLRPTLAVGLIKNLKDNLKYFLPGSGFSPKGNCLRLFEVGGVFSEIGSKFLEEKKIGGLLYIKNPAKKDDAFYELKGAMEILFNKLGLADEWVDSHIQEGLSESWRRILNKNKTAQIRSGDQLIGWVGELNSKIIDGLKLEGRPASPELQRGEPAIFELNFSSLIKLISEEREYRPPSKYPAIIRDLSITVNQDAKVEEVLNVIENVGGKILQDSDLFDIFEGGGENKKSLSFHLIYQSDERNLTDKEVNLIQEKIIKAIAEEGWEVRK